MSPAAVEPPSVRAGRSLVSALEGRPEPPAGDQSGRPCKITVKDLAFYYGAKRALEGISIDIPANLVTAFIGPSGCGKSTFLRTLNRMNDIVPGARVEGEIRIDGQDIYHARRWTWSPCAAASGWCSRSSNPFPKSIFENVAYGLRINGMAKSRGGTAGARRGEPEAGGASGTRSRTACTTPPWRSRAASSSGSASRARSRSSPTCC